MVRALRRALLTSRAADLATNIVEDAVYLAEGKQIKHHFED